MNPQTLKNQKGSNPFDGTVKNIKAWQNEERQKKKERRSIQLTQPSQQLNQSTRQFAPAISNLEAVKCDIAFKWMEQFEEMHQERVQTAERFCQEQTEAADKIKALETKAAKKGEKAIGLQKELDKSNNIIRQMKQLLKDQRKCFISRVNQQLIIFRQHAMIERQ